MLFLYVYDPDDDFDEALPGSATRPGAYLAASPGWTPAIEETLLVLDATGGELLLQLNPFGYLDALAAQMVEAADRLAAGERALIRSAGDFTAQFITLEPGGATTGVSALRHLPRPYASYYPLVKSPFHTAEAVDQRAELHRYVADHRDELRPTAADGRALDELQGIPVPTAELIAGLREDGRAGRELYEAMVAARR